MSRFLLLLLLVATLFVVNTSAQKRRSRKDDSNELSNSKLNKRGRKGGKRGKSGKGNKKMPKVTQDACTVAGHPCMLGQECIVERFTKEERCVCLEHCPKVPNAEVCGSDMRTYPTACHLYMEACQTHRMTFAMASGSCDMYHKEHLKIEPALAEACEGSYTSFKCTFDSMLESIFMWKKDGQEIPAKGEKYVVSEGGSILTVKMVMEEDEGLYECISVDKNGTELVANSTLKMNGMPWADIPSNHVNCEEGDRVMIPCDHSPDSEVSWLKNGFAIDEQDGMSMDNNGMLIMQQTEYNAAGTYECVASNFCGISKASCNVAVSERDPTRCEESVERVDCPTDTCMDMECEAMPQLECVATNCGECGYVWVDEDLRNVTCPVFEAPRIRNTQLVSLTPEGEDAVIPCEVTGYPKPTITWQTADDESIEGLPRHSLRGDSTLVIRQLVLGRDNGRYKCIAENSQGRTEAMIVIAILPRMTPMCPNPDDKIMKCDIDYCATAECPAYEDQMENVTCVNAVCNVCTYIFVDKRNTYVDCYSDPKLVQKMKNMGGMGGMAGWPASGNMGGNMGGGHGGSMGNMGAWPAGGSMGNMGAMPGWPAGGSMGNMGAMPGWPAGGAMGGMGSMAGWPAGGAMGGMGGGHGGMGSMAGWPTGGPGAMKATTAPPKGGKMAGMGMMDKNAWHFVPGWPGHMSQMNAGKKSGSSGASQQQAGGEGGHLNVFYSGKPEDEAEDKQEGA